MDEFEQKSLEAIYQDIDSDVDRMKPRCRASGDCCRFAEFGHTLFLTELEAEYLFAPGVPVLALNDLKACPFQQGGLCTARNRRPLGCRIYYCDEKTHDQQLDLSENYIAKLKTLHDHSGRAWKYQPLETFVAASVLSSSHHLVKETDQLNVPTIDLA